MRDQFQKGKATTLTFECPEGRPSADGDVTVFTSGEGKLDSSNLDGDGNATLDTATTTLSANASRGAEQITVTSTSGFKRGLSYVLENEYGQRQEVLVTGVGSGTLNLDEPLEWDATAGTSSIYSTRISVSLTTTHTATRRRRMRAVWEYTVGGETYRHTTFFDVVGAPFDLHITERAIEEVEPRAGQFLGSRLRVSKLIRGALRDIWSYLNGKQVEPDLVRDTSDLKLAACYRILQRATSSVEKAAGYRTDYGEALERFAASKVWWDSDDDFDRSGGGYDRVEFADGVTAIDLEASETLGSAHSEQGLPAAYMRWS